MLRTEFERFHGREILELTEPTVVVIFDGTLKITRQVEYFGLRWGVEKEGMFLLLEPGVYVVEGNALIFIAADHQPRVDPPHRPAPPQVQSLEAAT